MGRAAAIAHAREGADVAISYYPTEEPDAQKSDCLDARLKAAKPSFCPLTCGRKPSVKKLVADAVSALGGLDILVSNAGRQQARESILDLSSEDFDATIKTSICAPF